MPSGDDDGLGALAALATRPGRRARRQRNGNEHAAPGDVVVPIGDGPHSDSDDGVSALVALTQPPARRKHPRRSWQGALHASKCKQIKVAKEREAAAIAERTHIQKRMADAAAVVPAVAKIMGFKGKHMKMNEDRAVVVQKLAMAPTCKGQVESAIICQNKAADVCYRVGQRLQKTALEKMF